MRLQMRRRTNKTGKDKGREKLRVREDKRHRERGT